MHYQLTIISMVIDRALVCDILVFSQPSDKTKMH